MKKPVKKAQWTGRDLSRRQFVQVGAAGAAALGAAASGAPAVQSSGPKPVVIASGNGNRYKNGGDEVVVERAFRMMTEGKDILESLIEGVKITELDPEDASVGFGGRPNDDGVVQLDSCCMHGPNRRAGGVAGIEGVRTPASVAYQVLQVTDHHLLVGKGRPGLRPQPGVQGRGRPEHAAVPGDVARMEAPHRSGALPRPEEAGRGGPRRRHVDGPGRADRRGGVLRDDQLRRPERERGPGGRHHPPAASRGRSPGGSGIRRSWAPGSTWTTPWARRAPPAGARPTSTGCARS